MTEENIDDAKRKLLVAEERLLESYFEVIRESYKGIENNEHRLKIMGELEKFLLRIKSGSIFDNLRGGNFGFDGERAYEVRRGLNLNMSDLAKIISSRRSKSAAAMISQYETGNRIPRIRLSGVVTKKYLLWLKENGYNPFHL